jgi:hypothetical protein
MLRVVLASVIAVLLIVPLVVLASIAGERPTSATVMQGVRADAVEPELPIASEIEGQDASASPALALTW